MMRVLSSTWALMLGMLFLMVGNGIQGTLLGVRGGIESFTTLEMSFVMAGYFLGFLGGSRLAPELIRRVGHVRVFAALGSLISAILILSTNGWMLIRPPRANRSPSARLWNWQTGVRASTRSDSTCRSGKIPASPCSHLSLKQPDQS